MRKRLRLKKMVSALLAVAMIGQSCLVTTAGDLTDDAVIVAMQEQAAAEEAAARKAAEEKAAQEAAAAQKAAEEAAAQKAAEEAAAAQKAAEEEAAAQKAAEEAAAQKAAEDAAAQKAAEEAAAAQKAAEEAAAAQKAAEEAAAAQKAAEEAAAAQKAAEDAAAQKAAEEAAAQEAAAAQKAAEDAAAQKAAEEAAAQKAAEEAAAQKAAEDAAAQKAAEDAAAQKAAEEKAAQEITYRVTFEAHAADYGSIYVRGESGPIASVSSYYKEVKENGSFAFTIHANDGYEVEHVRYADTNAELPKNAQGVYEIAAVTRNVKVVVTYKIVPQETADAAVETEADEGQTEAPTDESETEEDREAETEVGTENTAEESTEAESEYETEPGTEAESETESESEKEILMPEFHYNGVCNGIAVAIRAPEGVFPEGTKAVLAAPSAESLAAAAAASGQDASDLMGVDITFRYDGKEIQPTSAVEVSFRAAEIADADISNVYHVSDGGAVQEVTASKSGASLGFTADSFSTWIFPTAGGAVAPASILDPETSIATYVFKADGETVDTQYITSGDTLSEPAAPVKEGHQFIGWYVGEIPVTFGTVSTVSETAEIIVEARFEEVYYVFFHNPKGAVVATKEGRAGDEITTSDVTFAVGAEESITGWYEASDSGSAVESVKLSDSNVDLYAKVENGFWVTYDSDGGSYVAPEFYPAGETAELSAQPTKNGYSFEGWYDGDARVNSTTMSVSVKAKWKENSSADYRVIYWQQKVTDDKNATDAQKTYAYVATETKTGKPGTTVNVNAITKSFDGFKKNTVNSKSVTIAADGSTIMNVYYDRVLCTVNYYVSGYYGSSWQIARTVTGLYGANLKEGEWWTDYRWYSSYWRSEVYGSGCILLTQYDFKTAGYANNAGNISSYGVVTTCNFYGTGKETGGTVYYYNEQADGSFKLVNTVDTSGGTLTIHQKYAGYDLYKYTTGKISGKPTTAEFWKDKADCYDGVQTKKSTVYIASTLRTFRLDYSNGGEVQHHETVKYTASLNGYDAKFTPTTRPATVDANYTFDGWYSDPECTKKFDFNTTMPATNIVVYAGWKAPEVRVTAHRSPEDMPGVNVEAAYGESVDEHRLPTISYDAETQEFLGWFTRNADGSYRPWDFSTKIYSDVDLYARVISKGTFKVSYYANGGTGTVEDGRAYAQGAKADVKAITGITAPTGKTFLYWSLNADGSGKKYYPNNTIEIEGDITLYAIWGDTATTSLTYHGNGGATSDGKTEVVVFGLKNNQKVKAEGAIFARTGYKFIGWSTNSEATAAEYAAGADVIVHADETENVLYAVWEIRNDYQYTVHYYWNGTTEKVAEDKVVPNQTYNETITESPITIEGYTPVNSGSKEMVIDAENKTLTFYYYKNVRLTANSDTKVYNGHEQSVSGFTGAPEGADFSAIQVGAKGTNAGEYPAAFAKGTIGTVDKTEKYIVKGATDGKLTIKPVADEVVVTIEGNHDSKVYDGTEHVVTGYEVTEISNVLYTKDNFSFSGNAEAKRTAVGKTDMGLTAANFKNESANFSNVTFKVTDGYMEITPAGDAVVVTIEGNNASAVYDGAEHKVTGYTVVSISNKLYKESDFSFSGTAEAKRTEAGTTYMGLKEEYFKNENANFSKVIFNVTDGYMEITPVADEVVVTIAGNNASAVYDGTEHKVTGYKVTAISNELYKESDFSFSGTAEAKRTEAGTTYMGLKAEDFANKSANFSNVTFEITDGYMEITSVTEEVVVTIVGNNASAVYDGTEHKVTGYTVVSISNKLYKESDFSFSGTAEAKRTEAGTTYMGLTAEDFANKSANFSNVTFKVTDGYMEITPVMEEVVVTIIGNHDSKTYDGTEHKVTGYKVTDISNELYAEGDFDFSGTAEAKRTEAGTTYMGLKAEDFANKSANFSNVTFEITDGYMEITSVTEEVVVTIVGNNASAVYDGTEHKVTGYTVVSISNKLYKESDFSFSGTAEAKRTEAGTTYMGLTAEDFANKSANFSNVTFEVTDGYMEITPVTDEVVVTIEGNHDSKTYDGTEHVVTGYEVTGISNVLYTKDNFSFSGNAEAKRTAVGKTDMSLTAANFKNESANFSNVTFEVTDGYMEITPAGDAVVVTIVGNNASAVYDGTEHKVTGYTVVSISNKLYKESDFSFSGTAEAKRTEAGTTYMGLKEEYFKNENANFSKVIFNVTDGYMEITPVADEVVVTITGNNASAVYDGEEHVVTGYEVTEISNVLYTKDNFSFSGNAEAKRTAVGTTDMGLTAANFKNESANFSNVTFKITDGYMEITPVVDEVVVTIAGNNASAVYDGTEHKVTGYTVVSISNKLYKESDFSFSGTAEAKRTEAGTTYMGLTAEDFANKSENFNNVTFKVTDGYMEITPVTEEVVVTIVGNHDSKVYDGTEHKVTGYEVTGISNVLYTKDNFSFSGTAEAKRTEAGTTYMGLKAEDFANKSANFSNVTFKVTDGYMEITPITDEVVVTITGNHDSTVYDGEEHEVIGYDVAISNPLYTEGDFTFSGTAEVAGTNADTYEMGLSADDFTNTSGNFANVRFDVTDGFLKITKREVEFTANSASKAYDGKALTDDGYTLTGGSLAENQNETVTVVGSQTLVGSSDNEITEVGIVAGGAVTRALGEDVTDNYAITTIKGTLTVTDGTENDPVDPGKVVTKTHEDAAYDLGETVTFTISVTNIYDTAKTITITELPGVAIEGADASKPNVLVVTDVPAGETITATATYTITWQDIANGSFVNTVKAEFSDGKPFETTDTVTVVDPVYDYTMEKTAKVPEHESGMVKEGETIGYTIRVQNTGNQPLEEIRLTDTLNAAGTIANIRGAEYVQDGKVTIFTIKDLQPNQTITITYEYVVLNADKGKTISNAVVGPNPDPEKPGKEGDTETTVEDPKLEVNKEVKAITAADGTEKDVTAEAALNDIITYTVTVKNTGNVVLTDVHVADSLEGIKLAEGQSFEFTKLEAGETQTITYTYQVQEKDLGLMIVNKATATAKVPEDPEDKPQPKDEDEKEVPTEDRNPSLKVEKEVTSKAAAEDGRYIAGETITYKVTVTNNGNLTLKDVVLKDVLTRADGTTVLPDGWESDGQKIGEMAPGATRVFEYSHKVTEEDLGGVLKNAATASGEPKLPNPDPEKPEPKPEGEDEKEVPTEERKPSLKAEKKVTSKPAAEDGKYTVGETITYEVTVTNTGNLTLKNIHVQDIMTRPDGTQMIPSGLTNQVQTIEGLEPNASETLRYTHVVTEQDLGGELKNAVTVSGEPSVPKPNPDPEKPEPKPEDKTEETVITEDPTNCSIIVTKKLTNMMDEALVLDNAVFYVALFTDEGLTNRIGEVKKLTFGANQSTATAVFAKIKRGIYYVAETDENGKVITSGAYNNGAFVAQYAAGQKVEIKENGTAAEFAFANQFLVLPSEYDLSKRVTIVKSVQTKKGKELKTNETFYAGIFSDAAHTQLAENVDQNIVPLATNGTAGARNEIEVTFAPGASTTLYIAEVSADGVPVEQNAAFEYTAGIDQNVITLSEDTDDATVKITNTSKKDEPETECEDNRQSESNKPKAAANSVKTGDDTPLMTFVLLLLCSASCMMLLAGRRKKEDGQDR